MKALAVLGSYRKGEGNTAGLLDMLLGEMRKLGAECEFVWLPSLRIEGCHGCNWCQGEDARKSGRRCLSNDGMQELYDDIEAADILIVATPVYMWHVTAQTKAFIDRLYTYSAGGLTGKRMAAVITAGGGPFDGLDLAVQSLTRFAEYNKMDYKGTLFCAPADSRKDLLTRDIPKQAKELAEELIKQE